jgi:3-ketoacyl-CoA synthase
MSCAVVVSAEILTVGWYSGKEHAKLLLNCYFRSGCSAVLVTNGSGGKGIVPPIKYRLLSLTRTNQIADDRSYRSGYLDDDDEAITGFTIGRDVGRMFGAVLRAHLVTLGPSVLPCREKLRYAATALLRTLRPARRGHEIRPDFRAAADHFCLPAAGEPIIVRMGQGLGLGEREMEASLATFRRFGNQSAASLWYQLAYLEAKGRVRKGDTVWQLAVGSGLKANSLLWERVTSCTDHDDR